MDDIERDPLMREKINLFKDEENIKKLSQKDLARKQMLNRRLKRRMLKVINVRVRDPQETIALQEQELQEKLRLADERRALKEEQKRLKEEAGDADDDYNRNEVKLAELLDDMHIEEQAAALQDAEEDNKVFDDDNFIDEFIKRLDHIKIEKD